MIYQSCDECYLMGKCEFTKDYNLYKDFISNVVKSITRDFSCAFLCKHFKRRFQYEKKVN